MQVTYPWSDDMEGALAARNELLRGDVNAPSGDNQRHIRAGIVAVICVSIVLASLLSLYLSWFASVALSNGFDFRVKPNLDVRLSARRDKQRNPTLASFLAIGLTLAY
jgi:hypothetical protein